MSKPRVERDYVSKSRYGFRILPGEGPGAGDFVDYSAAVGRGLGKAFEAGDFGAGTFHVLRGQRLGRGQLRECGAGQRQGSGDGERVGRHSARHSKTRRPRCRANGSKSRSLCSSRYPLSIQRVAITVSMVLRIVTPRLRRVRKFLAA